MTCTRHDVTQSPGNYPAIIDFERWAEDTGCGKAELDPEGKLFFHAAWVSRTLDQLLGLGMCFLGFSPLRLELRLALFIGRALDG